MFDRHPTLQDTQIINYRTSSDEKWMVLIGIKAEVSALCSPSCALPARSSSVPCRAWLSGVARGPSG